MAVSLDIADLRARQAATPVDLAATKGDGLGCHAGKDAMRAAAEAAGMSETLAQLRSDYPQGPHDQPQSMCRPSARCGSACACAGPPRSSRAAPAVSTA